MVRRRVTALALGLFWLGGACGREQDMSERMEMPDTMTIMRAMGDEEFQDSVMDVMPGGEMARGDSTAAANLLKDKM